MDIELGKLMDGSHDLKKMTLHYMQYEYIFHVDWCVFYIENEASWIINLFDFLGHDVLSLKNTPKKKKEKERKEKNYGFLGNLGNGFQNTIIQYFLVIGFIIFCCDKHYLRIRGTYFTLTEEKEKKK